MDHPEDGAFGDIETKSGTKDSEAVTREILSVVNSLPVGRAFDAVNRIVRRVQEVSS